MMRNTSKLRVRLLAFFLVSLGLSFGTANAQCNNPTTGSVPFNCTQGAAPQPGDLVLGGQNSQTVKWTWAQVFNPNGGLLPIATPITPGISRPDGSTITISNGILTAVGGGGGGSVSSVGLTMPGIFAVTNSPITGAGSIGVALNTASPNLIFAGPSSGSAATPTFRALTIADLPGGIAGPGGSTWSVQINAGAGAFSGQSLGSAQMLIGQASGTPLPETITGCPLTAGGAMACSLTTGVTGILPGANGGTGVANTGKTVTFASSLTTTGASTPTLAFPSSGTPAYTYPATSASLAGLGLAQTWGAAQTFPNGDICLGGSGSGCTIFSSAYAGSGTPTLTFPGIASTIAYEATTWTSGNCLQAGGTAGLITVTTNPCGSGGGGTALSVTDGLGTQIAPTAFLTLNGGAFSSGSTTPNAVWSPITAGRTVTANGGSCPTSSSTICANDSGNVVVFNGSNLTVTIPAISSTILPQYAQTTICNNNATALTIASTPTISGYTPTTIPGTQNGVASCLGLTNYTGTSLQASFVLPPGILFATVADQTVTGGFNYTPVSLGTPTNGSTVNIDCGAGFLQQLTNNVAGFTLAMGGSNKSQCIVNVTNGASAGVITPSGFTVGNDIGAYPMASIPTTNGSQFDIELTRISSLSRYKVSTYQTGTGVFTLVGTPVTWGAAQNGTSAAINTTGAQIMFVAVAYETAGGGLPSISDPTAGNTWTPYTNYLGTGGQTNIRMWSCGLQGTACTTNAADQIVVTGSATINFNAAVMAFSAPSGYANDGSAVGNVSAVAPNAQPGSITPAGAGDLFVTAVANTDGASSVSATINGGFTILPNYVEFNGTTLLGFGMAYLISTGASAQNPTWAFTGGTGASPATMVAIKP